MRTNGSPNKLKKSASIENTIVSQNTATPNHTKLNGISATSDPRRKMPWRGRPCHSIRSFGKSCPLNIWLFGFHIDYADWVEASRCDSEELLSRETLRTSCFLTS